VGHDKEVRVFDFFKSKTKLCQRDAIESLANSCQLELYTTALSAIEPKYPKSLAGRIAAGLANHIMQFGHQNTEHQKDQSLVELTQLELTVCHTYFGHKFQQNTLGCLILLAALWQIPIEKFKAHIQALHSFGLFELGSNTPDVRQNLDPKDLIYMYELTQLSD
jgi:hypothetical protein